MLDIDWADLELAEQGCGEVICKSSCNAVGDDCEANAALDVAEQAVRAVNHHCQGHMRLGRQGWRWAIMVALRDKLDRNLMKLGRSSTYKDHLEAAAEATIVAVESATQAAHHMFRGRADAQVAIHAVACAGCDREDDLS